MKLQLLKHFDAWLGIIVRGLKRKSVQDSVCPPHSILVIKLSAMGDALCLMPSIRMLFHAFPRAHIDWLTTTRSQPSLFRHIKFIRSILLLPTNPVSMISTLFGLWRKLQCYDLVIDYDQYYRISEFIAYQGRISAGFAAPLKGSTFSLHEVYQPFRNEKLQFKALTDTVICFFQHDSPNYSALLPELLSGFKPSSALIESADALMRLNKPVLVIYPGSSENASFRRWNVENYLHLVSEFLPICTVIVAGGPDEVSLKPGFRASGIQVYDWIAKWSLLEWAWFFRNYCHLFVGTDAGLLHLADLMGLRSVSIFGPNLYAKWGSINEESIGIEINLECRPCLKNYLGDVPQQCHRGDVACLNRIRVEDVSNKIRNMLFGESKTV